MRLYAGAALIFAACRFDAGAGGDRDAAVADAAVDTLAAVSDGEALTCASSDGLLGHLCLRPTGALAFNGPRFDTTTDKRCEPRFEPACVVAAQTITVADSVTVAGARPLVLFAAQTLDVSGTLDASSRLGSARGAGANSADCNAATTQADASNEGAGGGAGGSFGGSGGDGGSGNSNAGGGKPVMLGGTAGPPASVVTLRGGCAGQPGATGTGSDDGGVPGDGGGAIYLFASGSITIEGAVLASGAGGGGGSNYGGGGGGGTGGLVGLESPMITVTGIVAANGGGGGGGGSVEAPLVGGPGSDGATSPFDGIAAGGAPGLGAGPGAAGTSVAAPVSAQPTGALAGGGGGGGGLGVVWILGTLTGTQVSPAPLLH